LRRMAGSVGEERMASASPPGMTTMLCPTLILSLCVGPRVTSLAAAAALRTRRGGGCHDEPGRLGGGRDASNPVDEVSSPRQHQQRSGHQN
jgi:hypothetical protein